MNKKTLRKLTLSGVTLGVAALSLTSTTYAWFTTNGSAEAKGISGTVTAAEANMLIKSPTGWNGKTPIYDGSYAWDETTSTFTSTSVAASTFGRETTLVNESGKTTDGLKPVSILSSSETSAEQTPDGKFYELSGHSLSTTAASSSCYLHYQVVIALSGLVSGKNYTVRMEIPELYQQSAKQYLLVDAGEGAKAGKTIQVKIEDALSLGIKNTVVSADTDDTKKGTITEISSNNASGYYHAVEEKAELVDANNTKSDKLTGDALTYYKNVYGTSADSLSLPTSYTTCYKNADNQYFSKWNGATKADDLEDKNSKALYTVNGTDNGSFVCVTDLYFFIDGWDYQCFNAIGGLKLFDNEQDSIKFTLVTADNQ